jgi:hypothetical protein
VGEQEHDRQAAKSEAKFAELYDQLKQIAKSLLQKERRSHDLSETMLVNEAWLLLANRSKDAESLEDPALLLRLVSAMMREIIVANARLQNRRKVQTISEVRPESNAGESPEVKEVERLRQVVLDNPIELRIRVPIGATDDEIKTVIRECVLAASKTHLSKGGSGLRLDTVKVYEHSGTPTEVLQ